MGLMNIEIDLKSRRDKQKELLAGADQRAVASRSEHRCAASHRVALRGAAPHRSAPRSSLVQYRAVMGRVHGPLTGFARRTGYMYHMILYEIILHYAMLCHII